MKPILRTLLASGAIAVAALGIAGPANARHYQDPQVYVVQQAPAPVYAPRPAYVADYDDREWRGDRHEWRGEWRGGERRHWCGAPRWEPQVRYAPGMVVRRHGELFIARRVSAHVWNVNSPPEWTPNYWAPAQC